MFYYVEGTVAAVGTNLAVIDCNGVGYACNTSTYTLSSLTQGEKARLYTYLHVREDAMDLFGFYEEEELRCFKMLLGISGVGPKAALNILSVVTPGQLALSIISGDTTAITQAQGVGKKLAQRIILETKDQISKQQSILTEQENAEVPTVSNGNKEKEVIAALQVLGYKQAEAVKALRGLDIENNSVEQLIRLTLAKMMG